MLSDNSIFSSLDFSDQSWCKGDQFCWENCSVQCSLCRGKLKCNILWSEISIVVLSVQCSVQFNGKIVQFNVLSV